MNKEQVGKFFKTVLYKGIFVFLLYYLLITNDLVNYCDGLFTSPYYKAGDWELRIGRWLLRYVDMLTGGLAINPFASIGALFFFLLGVQLIWSMTGERHGCWKDYFCSFFFLGNPYVCVVLSYRYTSLSYALGFLLSVSAILLIFRSVDEKGKRMTAMWLGAVLLIACAMAVYQSNLGFMSLLTLFGLYLLTFRIEAKGKSIGRYIGSALLCGLFGGLSYLLILKEELIRHGLKMSGYKNAGDFSVRTIIASIPASFKTVYQYFKCYFGGAWNASVRWNRLCSGRWARIELILIVLLFLLLFFKGFKKNKVAAVLLLPVFLLFPAFINITEFLTPGAGFLIQQSGPFALFIMLIAMLFLLELPGTISRKVLDKAAVALIVCVIGLFLYGELMQTVIDQEAMKEGLIANDSLVQSVTDYLIRTGRYDEKQKYAIMGTPSGSPLYYTSEIYDKANAYARTGDFIWPSYHMQKSWTGAVRYRKGIMLKNIKKKEYARFYDDQRVLNMPVFPTEGSVQELDGVIIIKVAER